MLVLIPILCLFWLIKVQRPEQRIKASVPSQSVPTSKQSDPLRNPSIESSAVATGPHYLPAGQADFKIQDPGTEYLLSGRVSTDEDKPAEGALVSLYLSRPEAPKYEWPPVIKSQTCDFNGRYSIRLEGPLSGARLVVDKIGYALLEDICDIPVPGTRQKDYVLTKAAGCVEGIVFDERDAPVSGAGVSITTMMTNSGNDASHILPTTKIAGNSGRYLIDRLPDGPRQVNAFARGFLRTSQTVPIGSGPCAVLDFHLKPSRTISFVVRSKSGLPLAGATAMLSRPGTPNFVGPMSKTSEVGRLEWNAPLDAEPVECNVNASGFKSKTFTLDPKEPLAEVILEDANIFSGIVLTEAGKSVAGAQVSVIGTRSLGTPVTGLVQEAVTGADGRFSVPVSLEPVHQVRARKEGFEEQNIVFETEPPPKMLEIHLSRADTGIFGRVMDKEGKPVRRFSLYFHDSSVQSSLGVMRWFDNEKGEFFVSDLGPGTYEVIVSTNSIPPQEARLHQLDIRKGFYLGELLVEVSSPTASGK